MRKNANITLEFNIILEQLAEQAISKKAKEKLLLLTPFLSERQCKNKMEETTQARKILESFGTPPLSSMKELDKIFELTAKGSMLIPQQLTGVSSFIYSCKRMKSYLKKAEDINIPLGVYGASFIELEYLYDEIERSIRNERVDDNASTTLRDIRRRVDNADNAVKAKLESMLRSKKEWFVDGYVATRNGRVVLPVKKEYKNLVSGTVVDTSSTKSTYFIEPTAVKKLQEELFNLQIEEENEVRKILYTLTALVDEHISELKINMDCMEKLDFTFAKAKLSVAMGGVAVTINTHRKIVINKGRHPLLEKDLCVPIDFCIGDGVNGVIITGPNTGGKTVALKTVGLLSLMAQSGLHVPVSEGSIFCMHNEILCDIGDGQSITENLSTFSSHITNIVDILKRVTSESLVLLDEVGSGTDPTEGMGIAVAILDALRQSGCLFLSTTHYPEIKDFAQNTTGLTNARMEFDRESLKPLYKLQIGEAGESCALHIAKRLGFPTDLLIRAEAEAYKKADSTELQVEQNATLAVKPPVSKIIREEIKKTAPLHSQSFNMGDNVRIYPQKELGIVYKQANEMGELVVQIKGKKQLINHKRIKLITPASELYPENYDFSIIFDTVENRKARKEMNKRHNENLVIKYDEFSG